MIRPKKQVEPGLGKAETKETATTRVSVYEEDIQKIKTTLDQLQIDKETLLAIFGLWASVLTFVTLEFQFLKGLYSWQKIVGFSLILIALLHSFNIGLDYLIRSRSNKEIPSGHRDFYYFMAVLFLVGLIFTFWGSEEITREKEVYKVAYDTFQKEQGNVYNSYDEKLAEIKLECDRYKDALKAIRAELYEMHLKQHNSIVPTSE